MNSFSYTAGAGMGLPRRAILTILSGAMRLGELHRRSLSPRLTATLHGIQIVAPSPSGWAFDQPGRSQHFPREHRTLGRLARDLAMTRWPMALLRAYDVAGMYVVLSSASPGDELVVVVTRLDPVHTRPTR